MSEPDTLPVARMPVISLWQPYASLIFTGHKRHETRGFRYPARLEGKVIAIHATAKFPPLKLISEDLHELCYEVFGCSYNYSLPFGAILGTVRLSGCFSTDMRVASPRRDDITAGDWSGGRSAWLLSDVTPLVAPLPMKGKQGWWSVPADLIAKAQAIVVGGVE